MLYNTLNRNDRDRDVEFGGVNGNTSSGSSLRSSAVA
jgi:hypothetical protein